MPETKKWNGQLLHPEDWPRLIFGTCSGHACRDLVHFAMHRLEHTNIDRFVRTNKYAFGPTNALDHYVTTGQKHVLSNSGIHSQAKPQPSHEALDILRDLCVVCVLCVFVVVGKFLLLVCVFF